MNSIPDFATEYKRFLKWFGDQTGITWPASHLTMTPALWDAWLAGQCLEESHCANCKNPFLRRRGSSRARYCQAKRCRAITKIKNSVATFSSLPATECTEYRADLDYHGRPYV